MTHLKITLSDTSEMLGSSSNTIGARIIKKLYELALAGLDNTSELSGVVSVDKAHRNAVEYLLYHTNLRISVTGGYYIGFLDPLVELIFMEHSVGDGFGITENDAANYTPNDYYMPRWFANTNITSFDELAYFTHIRRYGYTNLPWNDNIGFQGCSNLTSIDVVNIEEIENKWENYTGGVFKNCINLTTVKNFKAVRIGGVMFLNCEKLQNINLSYVEKIAGNAFDGCSMLDVKLCGLDFTKITHCEPSSFRGCPNIGDVQMPLMAGEFTSPFKDCTSITSISNLPNITSLSGPDNNWKGLFYGCSSLDTIDFSLSTNVTTAPRGTAGVVSNLRILKLPSSITTMNALVIYDCPRLLALVMLATTPPTFDSLWVYGSNVSQTFKIYVPDNSVSAYLSALSNYSSRIFSLTQYAIDFPND